LFVALFFAVLVTGFVAAHEVIDGEEGAFDWHLSHMISHHGGLENWEEDHVGLDLDERGEYGFREGWGCH